MDDVEAGVGQPIDERDRHAPIVLHYQDLHQRILTAGGPRAWKAGSLTNLRCSEEDGGTGESLALLVVKRTALTTALTLGGLVTAGLATAYVNANVMNAGESAADTNRVQLNPLPTTTTEAPEPAPTTTAAPTTPAPTEPPTTVATTPAAVATEAPVVTEAPAPPPPAPEPAPTPAVTATRRTTVRTNTAPATAAPAVAGPPETPSPPPAATPAPAGPTGGLTLVDPISGGIPDD